MTKHTLLAVVGSNPQVITEAIYAFYHELDITFSKLVVVTTEREKENIWLALQGQRGESLPMLARLLNDYSLPDIDFTYDNILVPTLACGDPIKDTKTQEEVAVSSDFILDVVNRLTQEKAHLHTLISGGRKVMAFYTGYAMSMYARKYDTLNHVFVDSNYESSEFYYPTPYQHLIFTEQGQKDAQDARVLLSSVPFIRMRDSMPLDLLNESTSFNEAVNVFNSFNQPISLEVDLDNHALICSGVVIHLSLTNFVFYLLFLDDLMASNNGFLCPVAGEEDISLALLYLNKRFEVEYFNRSFDCLEKALSFASENVASFRDSEIKGLGSGMKSTFFNQRKSEISKRLREELPEVVAEHYDINSLSKFKRSGSRKKISYFGILLDPNDVSFIKNSQGFER